MAEAISELFRVRERFLRSAHLERDFHDSSVLSGYIATDLARASLRRIGEGLKATSGHRAWRITGDYGSGKSSFALLLAHCFARREASLPPSIRKIIDHAGWSQPRFLPVLVTCSRQSLGKSILSALIRVVREAYGRNPKIGIATKLERFAKSNKEPSDDEVLHLLLEANSQIILDSKGKGLLLVLDELGKYLEFAALRSDEQDVFLLQRLAESASRSREEPLFVVSIVHQGFDAYAEHLSQSAQREWQKVAGRFEEIVFDQPVGQITELIASALNVDVGRIASAQRHDLAEAMNRTISFGWFGVKGQKELLEGSGRLYPLHPSVLPVLIRTFRRFGQNERSIFSFLLANEPFGLRAFSDRPLDGASVYRLHNFYDYVRTNFGHRLAVQSYRSHWNLIDSVIETFSGENELEIKLLKTIGILNLLNDSDLLPTKEVLVNAVANTSRAQREKAEDALTKLHRVKRSLYDRGRVRGFCLWPHTSADLEKAYDESLRAVGTPQRIADAIKDQLETRPIVARRHYIETGNLRHWEIRYCSVVELLGLVEQSSPVADGVILMPLCETPSERAAAVRCASDLHGKRGQPLLIAVSPPLSGLAALIEEVQRWEWIDANTPELNGDKYAREELSRQKAAATAQLKKRVDDLLGFRRSGGLLSTQWFSRGRRLNVGNSRELLEILSGIFDQEFPSAPWIHNELVNRRTLSSAAAAARMRLIERLFSGAGKPLLGMDNDKKPPEMSMYLSVLKNTSLHRLKGGRWLIDKPSARHDPGHVLPTFIKIDELIRLQADTRVNINAIQEELGRSPYGVRDGLLPLLLTIFVICNKDELAIYKDGSFLPEPDARTMLELTKMPSRFELQYCTIRGVRGEVFEKLSKAFQIKPSKQRTVKVLGIARELCVFVAKLPPYVHNTKRLSPVTGAVRNAILAAHDPVRLIFTDLPEACGLASIPAGGKVKYEVQLFVSRLIKAIQELRTVFSNLESRIQNEIAQVFHTPKAIQALRKSLANRADRVLIAVTEPQLKGFCLRIVDGVLSDSSWTESIGSYLTLKPPSTWHDLDEDRFATELSAVANKFHRVESIAFKTEKLPRNATGIRVAVTRSNGTEQERVIHFTAAEEERLRTLEKRVETVFSGDARLGLVAASRAIWATLAKSVSKE